VGFEYNEYDNWISELNLRFKKRRDLYWDVLRRE